MTHIEKLINETVYDEMFCKFLDEGKSATEAAESADFGLFKVLEMLDTV